MSFSVLKTVFKHVYKTKTFENKEVWYKLFTQVFLTINIYSSDVNNLFYKIV